MPWQTPPIVLQSCPKQYCRDLDKALAPEQTIERVSKRIAASGRDIFAGARRVDVGRLGIPVYLGLCGSDARTIMPVRKQMGKGSSPAQAQASALMEVMERYAFFSFWERPDLTVNVTWKKAEELFGDSLLPVSEMLRSVQDSLDPETAAELLDLTEWQFYPATRLEDGARVWLPLDWFRMLGEFNGSAAGNTPEESVLQALSELIERHVSQITARDQPTLPTINPESCHDPALRDLIAAFARQGIFLILKDMSLGMPLPTVGALAWDPATFPRSSEIVFTAGTASTPAKAAIRAITEVAQLGGDFCSNSRYEASGLPKYTAPAQFAWLLDGPLADLSTLPNAGNNDIRQEIMAAIAGLAPIEVYGVDITNPLLDLPAHYIIAPGLQFRERDRNQSLGLFTSRKLAEEAPAHIASAGLDTLERLYPHAHFIPFQRGMLALRQNAPQKALRYFDSAIPIQPDAEARAMASFYAGHALSQMGDWRAALPYLQTASELSPEVKEYANLLGVAHFKGGEYAEAETCFDRALNQDRGSAIDLANRGLCRKFQGKNAEAEEDLRAALALDPSLEFARTHLRELAGDSRQ